MQEFGSANTPASEVPIRFHAARTDEKSASKLPIPLQATLVAFGAAVVAAPTYLLWFALQAFETTSGWAWLAPAVGAAVQLVFLQRFVIRARLAGMVRAEASPWLTSVITTAASASLWLAPYLPSFTGPRGNLNRYAVGLDVAVPCALIWLAACAALALAPRRKLENLAE